MLSSNPIRLISGTHTHSQAGTVTTSKNAIVNAGLGPDNLAVAAITAMSFASDSGAKVWRDIRGAAQGRGIMHDVPTVAGVVARLKKDIAARSRIAATHFLR